MPLSATSKEVMNSMQKEYGAKKGKSVFYATANKKGGKPEAAGTWKKKQAAAQAFAGIIKRVAHVKQAAGEQDLMGLLRSYAPYLAAGGLGGVMLGDEETPLLERLLGGAALGGLGGYGIQNYALPWLQEKGIDVPGAVGQAKGYAAEKVPEALEGVRGAAAPLIQQMQETIQGPKVDEAARVRDLARQLAAERLRGAMMRRDEALGLMGRAQERIGGAINEGVDAARAGVNNAIDATTGGAKSLMHGIGASLGNARNFVFGNPNAEY